MAQSTASFLLSPTYARRFRTCQPPPLYCLIKRLVDIVGAVLLIVLTMPLMFLTAVLIKLDSLGPVFFVQTRVGSRILRQRGQRVWQIRTFRFYKFRSMTDGASEALHRDFMREFCAGSGKTAGQDRVYKLQDDPRVTRLGKLLRKTSIDELPQLLNVLKGDMSLVGPRPATLYEIELYRDEYYERFAALPGITGLWQVRGRSRVPFADMIRMDVEYARHPSIWRDLQILILTIPAVVSLRGAK